MSFLARVFIEQETPMFHVPSVPASGGFGADKHPPLGVLASPAFLLKQQGKCNPVPGQGVVPVMNTMLRLDAAQRLSNLDTGFRNKNRTWTTGVRTKPEQLTWASW